jgi:3-dehydroquinate dehydratase type I
LKTRICVSILPKTITEAKTLIEKSREAQADLVEVRLDQLKDLTELASLKENGKTPLIATNRKAAIAKSDPQQTLLRAAKSGFEFIDIDLCTPNLKDNLKEINDFGTKLIISFHDYLKPMANNELEKILEQEIENGANICKIVTTAKTFGDNLTLLHFVRKASLKTKIISFAMGEKGKISRLLSPIFGAYLTFACLEGGNETAPGQMTIQEMRIAYGLLGIK